MVALESGKNGEIRSLNDDGSGFSKSAVQSSAGDTL
jgi:hypothetical protein